jgi:hypothetical protein
MTEPKQTVPSNWDEAARWLARAHQDLRVAEALLNDTEPGAEAELNGAS